MTTRHAEGVSLTWIAFGCAGVATALAASAMLRTPCNSGQIAALQQEIRDLEAELASRPTGVDPFTAPPPSCVILDHGPYVALSERFHVADANSVTGVSGITDEVAFTETTHVITRELGAGFGIRYHAFYVPRGAEVTWRVVYPHAIRGFEDWRHTEEVPAGGHVRHVLYDFDYDYEMVAGEWKFEILIDGEVRCGYSFDVK